MMLKEVITMDTGVIKFHVLHNAALVLVLTVMAAIF